MVDGGARVEDARVEGRALDEGMRGLGTGCKGGREDKELAESVRKGV